MSYCVLCAHSIYDETQVIMAAHEVSKSNVGMVAVSRECKGFTMDNLQRASHRPMAICQIQNSRIVDEDYSMDWAIR